MEKEKIKKKKKKAKSMKENRVGKNFYEGSNQVTQIRISARDVVRM